MEKLIGWVVTPVYLFTFVLILIIFHPLQMIAIRFGYRAHKFIVDIMCACLVASLRIVGSPVRFKVPADLPVDQPVILVSNHQSMFDIPILTWGFRKIHPKFISKIELGRYIPSVSFNLRHGGSVLIDRGNAKQSLKTIGDFGQRCNDRHFTACIFPEGTRARDGVLKPFKPSGLLKLLKTMPDAVVLPVLIEGSWKLLRYKLKPVPFGVPVSCCAYPIIGRDGVTDKEVLTAVEECLQSELAAARAISTTARVEDIDNSARSTATDCSALNEKNQQT